MLSTTNGMCGIDGPQLVERSDIQPFQGWEFGMPPTQGGASLTLGFKIEPPWGSRSKPRRNSEMNERAYIKAAARDATSVSTVRSGRRFFDFAERQQLAEGAPVSGMPLCDRRDEETKRRRDGNGDPRHV
jgi:hypothetical protein